MDALLQDLRYAARTLLRARGFVLVTTLILAVGIGANTTVFSVINALLLRPLPVAEPDRLVEVEEVRRGGGSATAYSHPRYVELRDGSGEVLSGLAAVGLKRVAIRVGSGPEMVLGGYVSGNYFGVLGIRPEAGRFFGPAEDRVGAPGAVAVVSEHLWKTRLGGELSALGRTIHLNGQPVTIVGVAPRGFGGTYVGVQADVWVPVALSPRLDRSSDEVLSVRGRQIWLTLIGRLRPDVSRTRAEAVLGFVARRSAPDLERTPPAAGVRLQALTGVPASARGVVIGFTAMLLATAGLVLLIAGTNVAGMMLARATVRRREVAVRLALGAGRGRLIRQLLTESLLLFLLGGTGGLLLTFWLVDAAAAFLPQLPVRVALDMAPDVRVLGFALLVTLATGVAFGLAPALRASRPDVLPALREASGGRAPGRTRLRNVFVVAQLAMSLLLLVTAGLFVQALRSALSVDLGFDPDGVVVAHMSPGAQGYDRSRSAKLHRRLVERMARLPGLESVGAAEFAPMDGIESSVDVEVLDGPGGGSPGSASPSMVARNLVDEGYFRTLRMPLVAGRGFTPADRVGAPPVVVVNETLARRFWPGQNPLGRRLRVLTTVSEVVGVVRDAKYQNLNERPAPFLYAPLPQNGTDRLALVVRSRMRPASTTAMIRREVAALAPDVPLDQVVPLSARVGESVLPQRLAAVMIGVFGLLGLGLAAVGIYGVLSFHVGQRTHEIGVRLVLGAHTGSVVRMVLRQGLLLAAVGVLLGTLAALAVTPLLSGLLYGVRATDPATFAVVVTIFALVSLLASYLPARRAARIDPMVSLRSE